MERSEYEAWDRGDRCHSGRGRAHGRGTSDPPGAGPGSARRPALTGIPPSGRRRSRPAAARGAAPRRSANPASSSSPTCSVGEIAERAGLKRIDVVAWRDFDDPEAGGSELHAHRVMTAWAKAGIDVSMTTSSVPDGRTVVRRDGYRVVRRSGRYAVFPRTMLSGALGRIGSGDGLVEIWNGMPFFSPLWAHCPHIVFLHHVHAEMWKMVLPAGMAESGYAIEHRVAPPVYRRSRIVTLSSSSKREIVDLLGIPGPRVSVTPPGVEPQFSPGGERSDVPLVVAVGRLVPVKRLPSARSRPWSSSSRAIPACGPSSPVRGTSARPSRPRSAPREPNRGSPCPGFALRART